MVRLSIVALSLSGCFAEDVYYHTQLLQTKVNPQKVAVDTAGAVQDDSTLFQKSFSKKLHRRSKEAVQTKFFAAMKGLRQGGRPKGRKDGGGGAGGPPPGGNGSAPQPGDPCANGACDGPPPGGGGGGGGGRGGGGDGPPPGGNGSAPQPGDPCANGACDGPPPGGAGGEGGPPPGGDGGEGGIPAEATEQCTSMYGEGVDVQKCWSCSMEAFMNDNQNDWYPDPNVGLRKLADRIDDCMGQTNLLTSVCEENYGEDVALLDCMVCGMMCECESPAVCDMDCHQGCMSMDQEAYKEEEHPRPEEPGDDNGVEDCKMFYGDDVSPDLCKECGDKCFEEAKAQAGSDGEAFFNIMLSCSDECMGHKNVVTDQCEAHYGPDVDLWGCFNCGMECGCDPEQCDAACHGGCMAGAGPAGDIPDMGTAPTYGMGGLLQESKSGKLQNLKFSSALRLFAKNAQLKAKAKSDVTDLMQTSKHLK